MEHLLGLLVAMHTQISAHQQHLTPLLRLRRCVAESSEEDDKCKFFARSYRSICPAEWVRRKDMHSSHPQSHLLFPSMQRLCYCCKRISLPGGALSSGVKQSTSSRDGSPL